MMYDSKVLLVDVHHVFALAGDARNEVPVTNVAKIEFPGKKKNSSKSVFSC